MNQSTSEPNWRTIIDAFPDPSLIIDKPGTVLHLNPPLVDLFPRARIGQSIALVSREPALLQAIQSPRNAETRAVVQLHDRVPIIRKLTAIITGLSVDEYRSGEPAFLIVFRDLTDQERHAQLRADFVANASHELRTPLASLKLIIETLQGAGRHDEARKEKFLGMMAAQAVRMNQLIDDLMSLNRVEMRAHLSPRDFVELTDLINQVAETMTPLADSQGIALNVVEAAGPIRVRGDREELIQVFQNLIQNGIRYGRRGGSVTMSFRQIKDSTPRPLVAVAVADTGIGIPPEHIPRLTERFYRVSAAASREKGGTGLGLAIVKHIVSRHRGELQIDSELTKGSTFTVVLPAQ